MNECLNIYVADSVYYQKYKKEKEKNVHYPCNFCLGHSSVRQSPSMANTSHMNIYQASHWSSAQGVQIECIHKTVFVLVHSIRTPGAL